MKIKSHCKRNHPLEGDNLYISPSGNRNCKACHRLHADEWAKRNREKHLELHRKRAETYRKNPENKERIKAVKKKLNATEKYKVAAKIRVDEWRKKNKEYFLNQRKEHYERNRDRITNYHRERHLRDNPGPAIRRVARGIKDGSIDITSAIKQIRELVAPLDGKSNQILRRNEGNDD